MPEGPELHLASRLVNSIGKGRLFSGKVVKSAVSVKNPDVDWEEEAYTISACSRGKEVKLTLTAVSESEDTKDDKKDVKSSPGKTVNILFRFGMSGNFKFVSVPDMHKHAHLNFFTREGNMVLSFVDYRRFGRWEITDDWGKGRGPCILQEYPEFRKHVLDNLDHRAFNRPVCETMLNQEFFNGVGNYLRAEALYRAGIPPFVSARSALEPLKKLDELKVKSEKPDLLALCNILSTEVINLEGMGYSVDGNRDYTDFTRWLQCYCNTDMKNIVDHNGRTMWYSGPLGPMAPKGGKSRGVKRYPKTGKGKQTESKDENGEPDEKKARMTRKKVKKAHDAAQKVGTTSKKKTKAVSKKQNKVTQSNRNTSTSKSSQKTTKVKRVAKKPSTSKATKTVEKQAGKQKKNKGQGARTNQNGTTISTPKASTTTTRSGRTVKMVYSDFNKI